VRGGGQGADAVGVNRVNSKAKIGGIVKDYHQVPGQ